ncbi:MAG: hypothetical protein ACQERX_02145 [Bacillota bacterium]
MNETIKGKTSLYFGFYLLFLWLNFLFLIKHTNFYVVAINSIMLFGTILSLIIMFLSEDIKKENKEDIEFIKIKGSYE